MCKDEASFKKLGGKPMAVCAALRRAELLLGLQGACSVPDPRGDRRGWHLAHALRRARIKDVVLALAL